MGEDLIPHTYTPPVRAIPCTGRVHYDICGVALRSHYVVNLRHERN